MKRLSIIVPYRNREEHRSKFVPHMLAYFSRDKFDKDIPHTITFVEQNDQADFNRGKLLNIGFALTEKVSDYTCFHDIDYLPIWADYRYPANPTRLIWYGADVVPYDVGDTVTIRHYHDRFFGAVILFTNQHFRLVNGYSNGYRGWGCEDSDLYRRCQEHGLTIDYRDGTYQPLVHRNQGLNRDLSLTKKAKQNQMRFEQRYKGGHFRELCDGDGLRQLDYRIDDRRPVLDPKGKPVPNMETILVTL